MRKSFKSATFTIVTGLLWGCSAGDDQGPDKDPLENNTFATTYDRGTLYVLVTSDAEHHDGVFVSLGTKVLIVSDEQKEERLPGFRKVIVNVQEGEHRGYVGTVSRNKLRALKAK